MEVQIFRKQVYNPETGEYTPEQVPTRGEIHRSRQIAGGVGTLSNIGTYNLGAGGSVGLMTHISLFNMPGTRTIAGPYAMIRLHDRHGTVESFMMHAGTNLASMPKFHDRSGDRMSPVHTLKGTISFSKSSAALIGTVIINYSLLIESPNLGSSTPS